MAGQPQHEALVEFFFGSCTPAITADPTPPPRCWLTPPAATDTSSPWTYLAFSRIREVCQRTGATLSLRPMLVGGVFNVNAPRPQYHYKLFRLFLVEGRA